ncbi:MAG: PKD domain-containing protein [Candidatus Sulfotelmatobacter sp.]
MSVEAQASRAQAPTTQKIENPHLLVETNRLGDIYTLRSKEHQRVSISARVAAEIDHRWISSSSYPHHEVKETSFAEGLDAGPQLTMTHSGRSGDPDLICQIRLHSRPAYAEIEVQVRNSTAARTTVQSIRVLEGVDPFVNLDGPAASDRVLSDSFSEDRPDMEIHDLAHVDDGVHLAVGSQLIYNRQSHQSLFLGALTSERWLTILHLHVDQKQSIAGYTLDSSGTTELTKQNSLRNSPKEDQIELSLPLDPGQTLASERVMASLAADYHTQLESYGEVIRALHHPRISAPTPIGWWSWTAYYFGITEGTALTNAEFLAAQLKDFGYNFFHIDEGYQYARGDYTSPVAYKFPHGIKKLEDQVRGLGLTPGIWTAPFEVAERSSGYLNHKDWLVHNAKGEPIHAGLVTQAPDTATDLDPLYVLDTTNPGAQQYLRETYTTLTRDWGIRYVKLDFMDDTAIEGYYYRPDTTAMEAQRIGLQVIRDAVGDGVLLDKDGSVMLNPVGIVDIGRVSSDTGHSFDASRTAAPGIAARYFMNRNFFTADPDAFTVSRQSIVESQNHGAQRPLTLEEAKVSIALAAVSGGLFEVGDDLPTLFADADRMALVKNRDLLDMARFGHAATPVDLMSYASEDEMPSIFLLRESKRQSILVVFNWTEKERKHQFSLAELGLATAHNQVVDVFSPGATVAENLDSLSLSLAPQSVKVVKIVDSSIPAAAPDLTAKIPEKIEAGKTVLFSAQTSADHVPALGYHWDFGDGTEADGMSVPHTFTHAANYTVHLKADGIEGVPFEKDFPVAVTGTVDTIFRPELYQRHPEKP